MSRRRLLVAACALLTVGWLDAERDRAAEGNRLYDASRYGEAVTAYGEGLSDHPASERLRFNLAAAQYKAGKVADAAATLEKLVPGVGSASSGDASIVSFAREASALEGAAAYNLGNARYRRGREIEERDAGGAIALYEESLLAYKRAMARGPEDEDPKFNHELVARHLAALKERLEKEREQRSEEPRPEETQDGEPQQDQERKTGEDGERQDAPGGEQEPAAGGEHEEGAEQARADEGAEPSPEQAPSQPAEGGEDRAQREQAPAADQPDRDQTQGAAGSEESARDDTVGGERGGGDAGSADAGQRSAGAQAGAGEGGDGGADGMTAADARALVDAARGEEVGPADVQGALALPAGIGEPENEW